MTDKKSMLATMANLAGDFARLALIGSKAGFPPTWVFLVGEEPVVFQTPWQDEDEKHFYISFLRMYMRKNVVRAYSVVTEAWAMDAPEGWEPGQPHIAPSESPDRREMVITFATDGTEVEWRTWNIQRDKEGNATELVAGPANTEGFETWMTQLL